MVRRPESGSKAELTFSRSLPGKWKLTSWLLRSRETATPLKMIAGTLCAVAGALQHAEICAPRADQVAILIGHQPGNLVQVSEIVNRPR